MRNIRWEFSSLETPKSSPVSFSNFSLLENPKIPSLVLLFQLLLTLKKISGVYQSFIPRCRLSEDLCRLSVVLKSSPPIIRVSISDTGTGSCLEEFQDLKCNRGGIGTEKWGNWLMMMMGSFPSKCKTTSISGNKIYHYHLNLRGSVSARRLTRLPSIPKNDAKFSGTEVCLSFSETIDALLKDIKYYFQKVRSLTLDVKVWESSIVELFRSLGNACYNSVWEGSF
ncbi:hypothetical protein J1N35_023068 [Gossypium stocksii]|uniref:Uncharacterized protein n=1 Tax=Gossypium stocksii TaxID=47602 RepID=A0A9D3VJE7_9ROSI|nr:hypothetical protein J1N35_023068 [Gossypium stocksii]